MRLLFAGICAISAALALSMTLALGGETQPPAFKVHVGDIWTYKETDDIESTAHPNLVMAVTEATDKQFTVRVRAANATGGNLIVFDYDWNAIQQGSIVYAPNDGRGAPSNADVGSEWKSTFKWKALNAGGGGRGEATGKCLAKEQIETGAGTFDALKCVNVIKVKPPSGAGVATETEITTWYAPKTLRWAKRTFVTKIGGHVTESKTQELLSFELKS